MYLCVKEMKTRVVNVGARLKLTDSTGLPLVAGSCANDRFLLNNVICIEIWVKNIATGLLQGSVEMRCVRGVCGVLSWNEES